MNTKTCATAGPTKLSPYWLQGRPKRTTLTTSRSLDFCSEKELIAQPGHRKQDWPLVGLREVVDNALDACEDAEIAPEITVTVTAARVGPIPR